jgi:hypothetical protein
MVIFVISIVIVICFNYKTIMLVYQKQISLYTTHNAVPTSLLSSYPHQIPNTFLPSMLVNLTTQLSNITGMLHAGIPSRV